MYNAGPVDPNQRAAFHQQGFARMQQVITATNNLNAVLTPAQKARAGGLLGTFGSGRGR
jgi:hypothetical protein